MREARRCAGVTWMLPSTNCGLECSPRSLPLDDSRAVLLTAEEPLDDTSSLEPQSLITPAGRQFDVETGTVVRYERAVARRSARSYWGGVNTPAMRPPRDCALETRGSGLHLRRDRGSRPFDNHR
jgi:hypothetical protein